MLNSIPYTLFTEWQGFYRVEPFGEWRADFRAGQIAQVVANANRDSKRTPKPYSPMDFMYDFSKEVEEPKAKSPEELKQKVLAMAAAFKAVVKRENHEHRTAVGSDRSGQHASEIRGTGI